VLDAFLKKRKKHGEDTGKIFPGNTELAIGGVRKLKAAMMVFDVANSSKFSDSEFIRYISPFLHMAFHIVNDRGGMVDKYTGDGALISFCDKNMSNQDACENALNTALDLSKLAKILNNKFNFSRINIRIGLDFGDIRVERIGVHGKTQFIIVGSIATCAKRLESVGKQISGFHENARILIGYDFYNIVPDKENTYFERFHPLGKRGKYFESVESAFSKKPPYAIYEYTGRWKK
jgi:class 3 adenylate cyclase